LELAGAALATVFGRSITLCVALWILTFRDKMITFMRPRLQSMLNSWRRVLYIGVPAAATNMLLPISAGVITRFIAAYGAEAVAGFGVATRVEMFALLVVFALSSVLGPFVGQNWGAKKYDRVMLGVKYSQQFSMGWGGIMLIILALLGRSVALVFNADPVVVSVATRYFWIVPIGYGAQGVLRLSTTTLSVLNKPLHAAILTLIQAFGLYIPFAYLGSHMVGLPGIFSAAALSYLIGAFVAYMWLKNSLKTDQRVYLSQQPGAEVSG
jgi:Na+-driven multidrug efflux pump